MDDVAKTNVSHGFHLFITMQYIYFSDSKEGNIADVIHL